MCCAAYVSLILVRIIDTRITVITKIIQKYISDTITFYNFVSLSMNKLHEIVNTISCIKVTYFLNGTLDVYCRQVLYKAV